MIGSLSTENRNQKTMNLDMMDIETLLNVMNEEDAKVIKAVKEQIPQIKKAVEGIICALHNGGRLIYMGAGTSGRIGVLDASECPPTFGVSKKDVVGLIAGGEYAITHPVEGAEDRKELGVEDLKGIGLNKNDVVVGLAASGRTPYVIGGLEYANHIGSLTITISCNSNSIISKISQIPIEVLCGPEVLTGSTRLKAGTAQKLICNMLSTASMVGIGKTYSNLMVDVQLSNEKLVDRAKRIVMEATQCDYDIASHFLKLAKNNPKIAIVMLLKEIDYVEAAVRLKKANGFVRKAIE
ncbi:N-acetylmuramic acid 6-phosphate etherase [Caldibacillus thermoamylovorans]